jgi:Zn-dependent protease with chaperone function
MNFYRHQAEAHASSRRLILLFGLAVVIVVAAIDAVVFTTFATLQPAKRGQSFAVSDWMELHPSEVLFTTLCVAAIIGLSCLYKIAQLSQGGGVVARSLGGVRVSADTSDPAERRLLNVVEEMAIASGVPMPEVYLLEQESGINAFAAGHNPANAAVAVTRGTLDTLNRAELQGVIAHEFSHILNGDMRLNIRLMGLLFGLMVIALIARTALRLTPRGRSGKAGGAIVAFAFVALVVLVVGYVGLFCGRVIQAAISRKREALADASAVQFTRDPSGLRGALVKIGAATGGSRIADAHVDEVAHMLFAPGMSRLLATHPPLVARIKVLDPQFNPKEIEVVRGRLLAPGSQPARDEPSSSFAPAMRGPAMAAVAGLNADGASLARLVGNPSPIHVERASGLLRAAPEAMVAAARHPQSARALLLALAIHPEHEHRLPQLQFIAERLGAGVQSAVARMAGEITQLAAEQRMPALLRAFPALRQLPSEERLQLLICLNLMLQREGVMSLSSYTLRKLAQVHLGDDLYPRTRPKQLPVKAVIGELQVVFSVLAKHGHQDAANAELAYDAGMNHLLADHKPPYGTFEDWPSKLDAALTRLDQLAIQAKEQLVVALVKTILYDSEIKIDEAELLRAVCGALHCPLPPLVDAAQGVAADA